LRAWAGALAALALCGCAQAPASPAHPLPAGPQIGVTARPVAFDPRDPADQSQGNFRYAGGLALTSVDTTRLHGLSDLKVWPDGRFLSVSDEGDVVEGRLELDTAGRLEGVADAKLYPLVGEDGQPLSAAGKDEADSEGIAELADGRRLVSLERDDRILLYPAGGGRPVRAPSPDAKFPYNLGMEALDVDPDAGADAYVVGAEASGQTWICRLSSGCAASALVAKPKDAGLSAVAVLPGGRRAYLLRSFSPLRWFRVTLRITDAEGRLLDELRLAPPLTVDNLEGLAALPSPDGSVRFYLISDDNFSRFERTLLLAFDWSPKPRRSP
jgi:hypothetical protein